MASGEVKVSTMTFLSDVPDDAKIYVVKPGETTPYYTTKAALLADILAGTTPNLQTRLLSVGAITVAGNTVSVASASALILGVEVINAEGISFMVPFAVEGKIRIDLIVLNSDGDLLRIAGTETDSGNIAVPPINLVPSTAVIVTQINVTDADLVTIIPTYLSFEEEQAIHNSNNPSATNPFATVNDTTLQAVVTQGGVVISTDGLKKVEIDKDNGQIKISTRPTTGGAWVVRSTIQNNAFAQANADGTLISQLLHYALTFQNPNTGDNTEYRYNSIVNALDDFNSVESLLPTATDTGYNPQKIALKPILNSYDFTAELGVDYETDQDLTVGDPDDQIGSYRVFVSNNTATIGGVGYPKGSRIYRYYDGTAWNTIQLIDKDYVDTEINNAVAGLLDDRGNHNASSNLFPSTGGSGSGGAILKGDLWTISVAGTLGGVAVTVGDVVRALVDTPGQTATNWVITENNIGYVPENNNNKTDTMSGNTASSVKFLSAKGVYDWVTSILVSATSSVAGIAKLYSGLGSNTDGSMTQKAISDELAKKVSFWGSAIDGASVANTLTITATYSQLIPANTFVAGDNIFLNFRATSPGAKTSASSIYFYVNTADNLSGATQLGLFTGVATSRTLKADRVLSIKGSTTKTINPAVPLSTDVGASAAMTSHTINWAIDQYIIFAIGHTVNDQTMFGDFYSIEKK